MKTRNKRKGNPLAGTAPPRGLIAGALFGFAAPILFMSGALPAPKARQSGVADDWRQVGADLRAAGRRGAR